MADKASQIEALIRAEFEAGLENNSSIYECLEAVKRKTADFKDAARYCDEIGSICSDAFKKFLNGQYLTDAEFTEELAKGTLVPMLKTVNQMGADVAADIQHLLNEKAGIGLIAQRADFNAGAANDLARKAADVAAEEGIERAQWVLDEPVKTFSRMVADETVRKNVEFQAQAGLYPRIQRRMVGGCCDWCARLAGAFDYGDEPDDIYRRHQRCRCLVEFFPGDGRRQDVHSKAWIEPKARKTSGLELFTAAEKDDIITESKAVGIKTSDNKLTHPINPISGERYIEHEIKFSDAQKGKKFGKHASDFGLTPSSSDGRNKLEQIVLDIVNNADERVYGDWRGQKDPVLIHIKGEDVVLENSTGEFISILKGGTANERVKKARGR